MQKNKRIEGTEEQQGGGEEDGAVDSGKLHQSLIQQGEGINEESEQGVAVDVVAGRPLADD